MLGSLHFSSSEKPLGSWRSLQTSVVHFQAETKRERGVLWAQTEAKAVLENIPSPSPSAEAHHRGWVWECYLQQKEDAVHRGKRSRGLRSSVSSQWRLRVHSRRPGHVTINSTLVAPWRLGMKILIIHSCDCLRTSSFMALTHPWIMPLTSTSSIDERFYSKAASLEDIAKLMGKVFPWSTRW